eukprot:1159054-Pelagomonas_calceolata.AAC.8
MKQSLVWYTDPWGAKNEDAANNQNDQGYWYNQRKEKSMQAKKPRALRKGPLTSKLARASSKCPHI